MALATSAVASPLLRYALPRRPVGGALAADAVDAAEAATEAATAAVPVEPEPA